jgi:hypothetical protein
MWTWFIEAQTVQRRTRAQSLSKGLASISSAMITAVRRGTSWYNSAEHAMPRLAPEYDEQRWLLKALREAAHELESQLWELDEKDLRWRPSEDGWSLKEIAAHLRDCEEHFLETIELIATRREPRLRALDADALVLERDYREVDLYDVLETFGYLRHRSVNVLWGLGPDDWERSGAHPYRGPVTISMLAREQSEHDLEHLWQARRLREGLASRATPVG